VGAGLIGFLVVLGLVVACVFLFRSMTRHLRKVPKSFDPPPPDNKPPGDDESVGR
jgi:O-antigen ligase